MEANLHALYWTIKVLGTGVLVGMIAVLLLLTAVIRQLDRNTSEIARLAEQLRRRDGD